jgi:superfamily II DNA/RNA helicase
VADDLVERGFAASPLHGDMAQAAREKALTRFREGKIQVLVATDVAARGIDVQDVTHVINYTCPEDEKTYIHRIGRTGRAGATGIAVTFVDWPDLHRWKMINKALDLPFDEPLETYSSSDHFLHDMGIPPGTKGRVIPEGQVVIPRQPRKDDNGRGGRGTSSRGGRGDGGREGGRGGGSRGGRSGGRTESRTESRPESRSESAPAATAAAEKPARSRSRNRRRTRGGGSDQPRPASE